MDNARVIRELGSLHSPRHSPRHSPHRSPHRSPPRRSLRVPLRGVAQALYEYAALYSSLLLLALICIGWSVLMLPLYAVLPARLGRRCIRYTIMGGFRLYARWLTLIDAYRLDLSAIDALRAGPPLILAPNHPSLIDALLILTRHPSLSCVMKSDLTANVLLGPGARAAGYIRNDSARQMVREAVADLQRAGTLLLFPEGTRTVGGPINTLTKSVAVISWRAAVPVQLLIIETDSPFLSKGRPLLARPSLPIHYRVRLGRRFDAPRHAGQLLAFTRELERQYRSELAAGPPTPSPATARR
jgi:1-acyl-sn-glycerol-3-phosphate acyltransferase